MLNPEGTKVAYMYCRVPGRQTVPRAELVALIRTLRCMEAARQWHIYIDAQYVINGLLTEDRSYYLLGRNGDQWQLVYDEILRLDGMGSTTLTSSRSNHMSPRKNHGASTV